MVSPGNQHCVNCIGTLSFPSSCRGATHRLADARSETTSRVAITRPPDRSTRTCTVCIRLTSPWRAAVDRWL